MQLKTIKKTIRTKMEDWLLSISDESLRKQVQESLIVSGGAIANMLLNEDVNDYDVYISDPDVLIALCEYYCKPLDIPVLDGRLAETYLEEYIQQKYGKQVQDEFVQEDDSIEMVIYRTLKEDQVKLMLVEGGFEVDYGERSDINPETGDVQEYRPLFFSPNAISLSDDLQIVCRFYGDPEQIHKNYDFVHATNYFTFKDGVVVNTDALLSLMTRQLRYQGSRYPITSIIRTRKFLKRGFNISAGEYLKMAYQVSCLDLTDPDVMEEQLIGVDIAYFQALIHILRGTDPSKWTNEHYLFALIDKVFGESEVQS